MAKLVSSVLICLMQNVLKQELIQSPISPDYRGEGSQFFLRGRFGFGLRIGIETHDATTNRRGR